MRVTLAVMGVWLALASSCAGSSVSVPDPVTLEGERTWYGVIGPLVTSRCATCHRSGDIAPFPLENYEQAFAVRAAMRRAVEERTMPPFPPDTRDESGCPKVDDVRQMSDDERQVLLAWLDDGAPQGTVRELPAPKPNKPLGDPSDRWPMAKPYTSHVTDGDDYRCFVIRPNHVANLPVGAVSVEPGERSIVHHAAVYLVPPDQLSKADALDGQDELPGYDCFGGIGLDTAYPAGVWVPGNDAPLKPPHSGVGYYLPVGWGWVVQNHYNLRGPAPADTSSVVMWRGDWLLTEVPHSAIFGDVGFSLPPMSESTVEVKGQVTGKEQTPTLTSAWEGRVYAVWGHQHLLGKSLEVDVVHPDGTSQCLLHIPRWSFHWQSIYRLKDFVPVKAGDTVRVRCRFLNDRQREVRYGEGTADEMCFASLAMLDL